MSIEQIRCFSNISSAAFDHIQAYLMSKYLLKVYKSCDNFFLAVDFEQVCTQKVLRSKDMADESLPPP